MGLWVSFHWQRASTSPSQLVADALQSTCTELLVLLLSSDLAQTQRAHMHAARVPCVFREGTGDGGGASQ